MVPMNLRKVLSYLTWLPPMEVTRPGFVQELTFRYVSNVLCDLFINEQIKLTIFRSDKCVPCLDQTRLENLFACEPA